MSTRKFYIDLTETFPTLPNAPIVEAVVQFNAPPLEPFQQATLKSLLESRFPTYKLLDQLQLEAGFQSSADGQMAIHQRSHWDGFRLQSGDDKYICQWKRNCLAFSRLRPYETWPKMLEAAMPFWNAYLETGRPDIIEGIGVRFISQLALDESERPSKYLEKFTPPLKGLGLRSETFFHQDSLPLRPYPYEVRLIRALQPAAEKLGAKRALIVDIDVVTTQAITFDRLEQSLEEMRYIKNKVFFAYMRDAAERFK